MANAKKCDRCGKLYDIGEVGRPRMIVDGSEKRLYIAVGSGRELDFCEECTSKLEEFLNFAQEDRKD